MLDFCGDPRDRLRRRDHPDPADQRGLRAHAPRRRALPLRHRPREPPRSVAATVRAPPDGGPCTADVKPENVLVTKDHRVKVMDLGVARLDGALSPSRTRARSWSACSTQLPSSCSGHSPTWTAAPTSMRSASCSTSCPPRSTRTRPTTWARSSRACSTAARGGAEWSARSCPRSSRSWSTPCSRGPRATGSAPRWTSCSRWRRARPRPVERAQPRDPRRDPPPPPASPRSPRPPSANGCSSSAPRGRGGAGRGPTTSCTCTTSGA